MNSHIYYLYTSKTTFKKTNFALLNLSYNKLISNSTKNYVSARSQEYK